MRLVWAMVMINLAPFSAHADGDLTQDAAAHLREAELACLRDADVREGVIKIGNALCIFSISTPIDAFTDDLFEGVDVVVLHSTGGHVASFVTLGKRLVKTNAQFVVPQRCESSCAMVLLPVLQNLVVRDGAIVALHTPLIYDVHQYAELLTARGTKARAFARVPGLTEDQWLSQVSEGMARNIFLREEWKGFLTANAVSPELFDLYKTPSSCAASLPPAEQGDYLTVVNKAFYANFTATTNWVWERTVSPNDVEMLFGADAAKYYCFSFVQ